MSGEKFEKLRGAGGIALGSLLVAAGVWIQLALLDDKGLFDNFQWDYEHVGKVAATGGINLVFIEMILFPLIGGGGALIMKGSEMVRTKSVS